MIVLDIFSMWYINVRIYMLTQVRSFAEHTHTHTECVYLFRYTCKYIHTYINI